MKLNTFKFINLVVVVFTTISFSGCSQEKKDNIPWKLLIDGNTTNGWNIKGGKATYSVADGIITGKTVNNTPNTFLTTNEHYGNFILELEYKVDPSMNSGIQIRSNSFPYYRNGQVHGYQIEIDPSKRAWSAGIYDEGRRRWLNPLKDNVNAQKAFKQNDWNHYRIEAIGDTIKTWINNVPASYLIDDKTASGFIGLQVHRIRPPQKEGTTISWKNIKILTEDLYKYSKKTPLKPIITKNQLTIYEGESGWKMLWDGKTTKGWRGAKLDSFPKQGWEIIDGELIVLSSGGAESAAGGDIVTEELYGDFELKVDFKLTKGANSGIKYYVDTNINKGPGSSIGLEYQILDDAVHPDAKLGSHERSRTACSLYDLIEANPKKPMHAIGEWNTAHIISKNNHVEHWLNGMKVLEYNRGSKAFLKLVAESKYAKWPGFGVLEKGQVLLQDHGDRVAFKNIKIKSL
ncbi:protein of unknown function [Algibacter lectus]|uniref:3-keto-disaccharide hydrolase n=1 Tax=Algibacter lectus TaxID=221126 RepID=UPI0008EE6F44|nr:DUF1080 domain-containing protein [Algibacter lectus]SFB96274.1 protein of unknown function [Algibacter lectus]